MHELASPSKGAQIVVATSFDERYPPENILDKKPNTFWASTGMYPQSFVLALPTCSKIDNVTIYCYNVKQLSLHRSNNSDPVEFRELLETELEATDGSLQKKTLSPDSCEARYLKFVIKSGYDHFCAVYKVQVNSFTP